MKYFLILFVSLWIGLLAVVQVFNSANSKLPPCVLSKYCSSIPNTMTCDKFSSLIELNITNCALNETKKTKYSALILKYPGVLDSNMDYMIDMVNLVNNLSDSEQAPGNLQFDLDIDSEGIDLTLFSSMTKASTNRSIFNNPTSLTFISTRSVGIYSNKDNILNKGVCNSKTYAGLMNSDGTNVLGNFKAITVFGVRFKGDICKYMFQNVTISLLETQGYPFRFENSSPSETLNSSITTLNLYSLNKIVLDTSFVDPDVFAKMRNFIITDSFIQKIQPDLFDNKFHCLKVLMLGIINLKGFFHSKDGVTWMKYLNKNKSMSFWNISLSDFKSIDQVTRNKLVDAFNQSGLEFQIYVRNGFGNARYPKDLYPNIDYQFPDQDFCLFHDAPLNRLVFFQIYITVSNITCTMAWLYRYQDVYNDIGLIAINLTQSLLTCNFTNLVSMCSQNMSDTTYQDDPYFIIYYVASQLNQAKVVLVDYMRPIFSGIGFLSNILVVLTIAYNHKRRNEIKVKKQSKIKDQEIVLLEQPIFKYILFNSILNSMYTLMNFLDSVIPCHLEFLTTGLRYVNTECTDKDTWLDVLGSLIKLMSNFSYIQISVNRYLLVGKDHPEWLIKISQIKIKRFFYLTLIISSILSVVNYFKVSFLVVRSTTFPNAILYTHGYYHFYYFDQNTQEKINQLGVLSAFTIIHDIFSYLLFCIVSLILDVLTVKNLRQALIEKEKVKGKGKSDKNTNKDTERRSIIMVVSSSLVNFIFRAPELIAIVFYYIVLGDGAYIFKRLCMSYFSCLLFVDFSNVFYIVSLCFFLLFYVKFNHLFRCSFIVFMKAMVCMKEKKG